jgi:hypothetical protein
MCGGTGKAMVKSNGLVRGTAMALCVMVSGCGDGGSGSVASAGSSGPPAGANANLLGTLKSESFANQVAQASLTISNSSATGSVGQPAGTFVYDATTQSYTMTVGGQSKTFTPSMIQAALGSSTETVYGITSGSTSDSLTLTTPGTSGRFTYEYVGGAFWEHVEGLSTTATSGNGTIYAATYGEPTAASAVPQTGQGLYNIDLIGVQSHGNVILPTGFAGSGTMDVNFASGAITLGGTITGSANAGATFSSTATLGAGGGFAGTIDLDIDTTQQGQLSGRFYGPAAQEVGAVFDTAAAQGSGFEATGVILGRQATASSDTTFNSLTGVDYFTADRVRQPTGGSAAFGTAQLTLVPSTPGTVDLMVAGPGYAATVNVAASLTQPQTMAVALGQPAGSSGFTPLYDPSTDGQFMRAGLWWDNTGATPYFDAMVYGYVTPAIDVPLSGWGGYALDLDAIVQKPGAASYEATGNGLLSVNFATGVMTADGSMQANSATLGQWTGTGTLNSSTSAFSGSLTTTGTETWNGTWQGHLYGGAASGVGGVFSQSGTDGSTMTGIVTGSLIGYSDPFQTLQNLTAATTFTSRYDTVVASWPGTPVQVWTVTSNPGPQVAYDPASDTYTISGGGGLYYDHSLSATLNAATLDNAGTNAEFTAYSAPGMTARVLNVGSSNPTIQLSYTSFVEVSVASTEQTGESAYQESHYIAIGLPTQVMPTGGTATYSGPVYGTGYTGNFGQQPLNPFNVTGTGTLAANFATGAMSSTLTLNAQAAGGTAQQALGSFAFGGTITANTFTASLGGSSTAPSGGMQGTFNGPQANEVGATWTITLPGPPGSPNSTGIAGAFVGKKN